jgi:hypothetical protein
MIIIIVLRLDSRVNSGQVLGHRSGMSTWIDPSQHKNKNTYYNSFKNKGGSSLPGSM